MILHSILLLVQFAEQYKPLALYTGATIVILSGAHAVRVLIRANSGNQKGNAHADAL